MIEVEAMGGMTKAIEAGWPKAQIETEAIQRQAAIDTGEQVIVGVNRFQRGKATPSTCWISTTTPCGRRRSSGSTPCAPAAMRSGSSDTGSAGARGAG